MATNLHNLDQIPDLQLSSTSTRNAAKAAGGSSRDHWFVERDKIHVIDGFNVRVHNKAHKEYVRWLADQMKAVGFLVDKSLSCYASKDEGGNELIYVTDGHTRLEAYDLATSEGADLGPIPVSLGKELQSQNLEDLTVRLVTTNSGRELSSLEKAAVYKRLINFRWSEKDIATRLGVTTQHVENLLLLASAQPAIRQMVANDEVAASLAIEAIRSYGVKALARLKEGLEGAIKVGKAKVTKQHLVSPTDRFAKRQAPQLFSVAKSVFADPGFAKLSPQVRETLAELLGLIEEASKKKTAKDVAKQAPKAKSKAAAKASPAKKNRKGSKGNENQKDLPLN